MQSRIWLLAVLVCAALTSNLPAGTKVNFDARGNVLVNGKPFFPVGVWVYKLDPTIMADLHEHRFNTILGNGFGPADIPLIEQHGLMCIAMPSDAMFNAAKDSPSLLGWYLEDEPEEHGLKPEDVKSAYEAIKAKDADHPLGITHDELIGPKKYIGACDFTMTDVYPITAKRDFPIASVGQHIDSTRQVHGPNWPNFAIVQTFGGPEADAGKWALPMPDEIHCMVFQALIHRANGIMYFSYWPQAAQTWASIADLNRQIDRIIPWLLADGDEIEVSCNQKDIEARVRKVGNGCFVMVVNDSPRFCDATFKAEKMPNQTLRILYESRNIQVASGVFKDRLAPFEGKIYLSGDEPALP